MDGGVTDNIGGVLYKVVNLGVDGGLFLIFVFCRGIESELRFRAATTKEKHYEKNQEDEPLKDTR